MKANQSTEMLTTLSLIGSSTGTLKVTELIGSSDSAWILPTSIVLQIDTCDPDQGSDEITYQGHQLKTYDLTGADATHYVILEGTDPKRRLAILVNETQEYAIRISQLPDAKEQPKVDYVKEAVSFEGRTLIVPDINALADQLYGAMS